MIRPAGVLFLTLLSPSSLPAQQYFPPGVLGATPQADEFKAEWYSKQLKAMREPSLWELSLKDPKAEVYRFVWLRTFHHPIAVRVVMRSGGSAWINSRMTSGQGGNEPGRIMRYGRSWLRKGLTQEFLVAIDNTGFWKVSTLPGKNELGGPDGAQWIIEGIKDGRYHIVDRHSPNPGDPVRVIGMLALKLARFRLRSNEVY